jgi:hypothetical protein
VHKHGLTLTSFQVFIYISYPLHALDKSLPSSTHFSDASGSPYIVGTTYTNNDNITILVASSSPCASRIPCVPGLVKASSCHHVKLGHYRRLSEV